MKSLKKYFLCGKIISGDFMKFKMKFSTAVYVLITAVICISIASIVLDALILAGKGGFMQGNTVITSISIVAAALLLTCCLLILFNSKYYFSENGFTVIYGFFPRVIPYENILAGAEEKMTHKLYLQYVDRDKKKDFLIIAVNVDEKYNDVIQSELEKRNKTFRRLNTPDDNE